jgi:hypothetical protein
MRVNFVLCILALVSLPFTFAGFNETYASSKKGASGDSTCICTTTACPVAGANKLTEGGGLVGEYEYALHGSQPVVVSAKATITKADLDKGTDTVKCTQDYARMISANWDNHPWGVVEARLRVERPEFPGLAALPSSFLARDEFYQYKEPFTRDDVDVLVSIDPASVDLTNRNVHRSDADFPQVWAKRYGKGRVFSSALGHTDASWDDPNVQRIVLEGIKWAIGTSSYEPKPHKAP